MWLKGLTVWLCASRTIPSLVMSLLNVPSTPFPLIFSSLATSLTPTVSPALSAGIRPKTLRHFARGWTAWPSRLACPSRTQVVDLAQIVDKSPAGSCLGVGHYVWGCAKDCVPCGYFEHQRRLKIRRHGDRTVFFLIVQHRVCGHRCAARSLAMSYLPLVAAQSA